MLCILVTISLLWCSPTPGEINLFAVWNCSGMHISCIWSLICLILMFLVVSSCNKCYIIMFLWFGYECSNPSIVKRALVPVTISNPSLGERGFQRPGKVRKEIIQRFYSSFRFLISCLLSAEGEFLVDEAWPGMLRDRKVWSPETKKINQDRSAVEIRIKYNCFVVSSLGNNNNNNINRTCQRLCCSATFQEHNINNCHIKKNTDNNNNNSSNNHNNNNKQIQQQKQDLPTSPL